MEYNKDKVDQLVQARFIPHPFPMVPASLLANAPAPEDFRSSQSLPG
jgi:hypothetical protein